MPNGKNYEIIPENMFFTQNFAIPIFQFFWNKMFYTYVHTRIMTNFRKDIVIHLEEIVHNFFNLKSIGDSKSLLYSDLYWTIDNCVLENWNFQNDAP